MKTICFWKNRKISILLTCKRNSERNSRINRWNQFSWFNILLKNMSRKWFNDFGNVTKPFKKLDDGDMVLKEAFKSKKEIKKYLN